MAAPSPSTLDIITAALRKLGAIGAGESAPSAEDTALALNEFNGIVEEKNLRRKNAAFERSESFTFTNSKQSYLIGPGPAIAGVPDFVISAGARPFRIEFASLVITNVIPNVQVPCAIINIEQYTDIAVPALSSQFPQVIYYQATVPNGTIFPYPAFPTSTSFQLNLTWWAQLDTVAIAEIATALILPQGYRRGLELSTAVACWLAFPKRTQLDELKKQERRAWAEIQSGNAAPPLISTTDGIGSGGSTYDWRSGQWQ